MGFSGFASLLAYLFLLAALLLYGIPIWGCPKDIDGSIVELSTNTTGFVKLELGYFGVCVSYPFSEASDASSSNTTQSGQRQCIASFDTARLTPSELAAELIRGMNLTITPSGQYNASLSSLIQAASVLRGAGLFGTSLPIAAFSLLSAAGPLFIIPLFFNLARRRKICNVLLLLAALCASLGLMLAGASTFSLLQVQAAQRVVGTLSLPGADRKSVV